MKIFKFKYFLNLLYQIWRFKYAEFIRGNHMLSGELPAKIWCHFIFSKHQTSSFSRSTSYFSMKLSPNYRKLNIQQKIEPWAMPVRHQKAAKISKNEFSTWHANSVFVFWTPSGLRQELSLSPNESKNIRSWCNLSSKLPLH